MPCLKKTPWAINPINPDRPCGDRVLFFRLDEGSHGADKAFLVTHSCGTLKILTCLGALIIQPYIQVNFVADSAAGKYRNIVILEKRSRK